MSKGALCGPENKICPRYAGSCREGTVHVQLYHVHVGYLSTIEYIYPAVTFDIAIAFICIKLFMKYGYLLSKIL